MYVRLYNLLLLWFLSSHKVDLNQEIPLYLINIMLTLHKSHRNIHNMIHLLIVSTGS